jgi:tetratricopeptide (TPR) repeat protein
LKELSDIDVKIEKLKDKEPTSERLNLLGDLYLKKKDRKRAIEYFYKAAAKVSPAQRDKTIAIYKKILKLSPSEINAYEGLIDIFSKAGLVAEETKHLMALAQLYQNKGDLERATLIFRRVYELDPKNKAAELFFSRGKVEETIRINDTVSEEYIPEMEESEEELEKRYIGMPSITKRKTSIFLIASVIVLSLIAGLSIYFLSGRGTKIGSTDNENLWKMNARIVKSEHFEIEATRLTDKLLHKLPIAVSLSKKGLSENGFYLIRIKAIKDCIPEDFVKNVGEYISLIDRQGKSIRPRELKELANIKKVIYKPNVCQREYGIIFTQFYIAYPKEMSTVGLSIDGLERQSPVIVKWD